MTLPRKTIKGHVTTPGLVSQATARVYLDPVEVLDGGTIRQIPKIEDIDGHALLVGEDVATPDPATGLYTFTSVPPTNSDQTIPTNFTLRLRILVEGEIVDMIVFDLPESAPDEQWRDQLVQLPADPLPASYPQLVNEAAAYAQQAQAAAQQAANAGGVVYNAEDDPPADGTWSTWFVTDPQTGAIIDWRTP